MDGRCNDDDDDETTNTMMTKTTTTTHHNNEQNNQIQGYRPLNTLEYQGMTTTRNNNDNKQSMTILLEYADVFVMCNNVHKLPMIVTKLNWKDKPHVDTYIDIQYFKQTNNNSNMKKISVFAQRFRFEGPLVVFRTSDSA